MSSNNFGFIFFTLRLGLNSCVRCPRVLECLSGNETDFQYKALIAGEKRATYNPTLIIKYPLKYGNVLTK